MIERKTTWLGIQRKIIANMTSESWKTVPHIGYSYEPEVTKFMAAVKELNNSGKHSSKITINTIMLKAIAEGLKAAPELNANIHFDAKRVKGYITEYEDIHASMTWVLPNNEMMTINLHDIGSKTLAELNDYINDTARKIGNTNLDEVMYSISFDDTIRELKKGKIFKAANRLIGAKLGKHKITTLKGREKKDYYAIPETDRLTKEDIRQGTVCISNIGSTTRGIRGRCTMLAIIPPEVFVICMSSVQKTPVVITDENGEDKIVPGNIMPMEMVFDHRALDFGKLIPFIKRMEEIFDNPQEIFSW
ncbi:MAG: 2-oxo acid dehydrogenase subunit E2 [Clostridia bacterium]|nr:2-oxo acid dehydrogenase subunit E2 [Clostridia bacterium]MBQ6466459.1 2-oxo acid dehydrogenase subunit E2 [Clostridia bacterium]MBR6335172.1 2-oxo acid dehydrogenase subunit E2 [Clostridia bacterium]